MKLSVRSLVASLLLTAAAGKSIHRGNGDISAESKLGQRLLSKARALNEEAQMTWVAGYSLKFHSCHSLMQVAAEEGGGNEDGSMLYTQHLVTFDLCPSGSCKSGARGCKNGAQYVVNMMDFVDAYTEAQMDAQEYACEMVRENCDCDNANDDEACEKGCYMDAELDYCIENDDEEEEEDFEIQRYMECAELEMEDNNNGNNYNYNNGNNGDIDRYRQYYVGPYCSSDGRKIHLGTFLDAGCSVLAKKGTYEALDYYGKSLPYSTGESIVKNDCIECLEPKEQNDGDEEDEDEVKALCEEMYERSGKCEKNIKDATYPDEGACEYIHKILPKLEKAHRQIQGSGGAEASVVFAWLFALSTIGLGVYCFLLVRKMRRAKLDLAASDGQIA